MEEKAKGKMKEAAGAFTGDEEKKAEGRAQQRKGEAREQATQKQRTRQEQAKAEQAEKERDRQERKDKGLLGGLGDTLSGRLTARHGDHASTHTGRGRSSQGVLPYRAGPLQPSRCAAIERWGSI